MARKFPSLSLSKFNSRVNLLIFTKFWFYPLAFNLQFKKGGRSLLSKEVYLFEKGKYLIYNIELPLDYSPIDGKTSHNAGLTADANEGRLLIYLTVRKQMAQSNAKRNPKAFT